MKKLFDETWIEKYKISEKRYKQERKDLLSLKYTPAQANKVILNLYSKDTVSKLLDFHYIAIGVFTRDQIVKMTIHNGGGKCLMAALECYDKLTAGQFTPEQIVRISAHIGGSKTIVAVLENLAELKKVGFSNDDIVRVASVIGGSLNIFFILENSKAIKKHLLQSDIRKVITTLRLGVKGRVNLLAAMQ